MVLGVIIVFLILGIVIALLRFFANELGEFENGFVYFVTGTMILIIGASVFLSYATPTFAQRTIIHIPQVFSDNSNLLLE